MCFFPVICFLLLSSKTNIVINKVLKMLGFILRNTRELKTFQVLKTLYCSLSSLVSYKLEYEVKIWTNLVDNVQCEFLKSIIAFCLNLPISRTSISFIEHSICIQPCDYTRLDVRYLVPDLLFIYDLLNNNIDYPELLSKIVTHNYSIRSSSLLFKN